ncbi:hypothetical protein C8Q74DRAFT_1369741 [Fomes fomentarius]|nr:hypothetical protein C8Q74DRAFT_1369741 [Fomes fomentarius]
MRLPRSHSVSLCPVQRLVVVRSAIYKQAYLLPSPLPTTATTIVVMLASSATPVSTSSSKPKPSGSSSSSQTNIRNIASSNGPVFF